MRTALKWASIAILAALVLGYPAQAAATSSFDLFVGEIVLVNGQERVYPTADRIVVGKVHCKPTAAGTMAITVKLKDGAPSTTFDLRVVPRVPWGYANQTYTLVTNKKGRGAARLAPAIPAVYVNAGTALVKIRLRKGNTSIAYATDLESIALN